MGGTGKFDPPTTYAEWVPLLEALKRADADSEVLDAMRRGSLVAQTGVTQRFAQRLVGVLDERMNKASDRMGAQLKRSCGSRPDQEGTLVRALLGMRAEFRFLLQVASVPAVPENLRGLLVERVHAQADAVQSSLELSALQHSGSVLSLGDATGWLASIIRGNRVNDLA